MLANTLVAIDDDCKYDVYTGPGLLSSLGDIMRECSDLADVKDVIVITDANVAPLYLECAKASLEAAGFASSGAIVPAGEVSKDIAYATDIWRYMAQLGFDRSCAVVALGGGVVGDLGGLVAALYMRGVPVVQVPTTLVAQADASIGGKTALNLPEGKNLVGTFYQPALVVEDTDTLYTLSVREWRSGLAEIAKTAAVSNAGFFSWMLDNASAIAAHDDAAAGEAIRRCVEFKSKIACVDERESLDVRARLNYGHTLGHAIEVCSGYSLFSHGEAVAEGMRFAAHLAPFATDVDDACKEFFASQNALLDSFGISHLEYSIATDRLLNAMHRDKKQRLRRIRFVFALGAGTCKLVSVDDDVIVHALEMFRQMR